MARNAFVPTEAARRRSRVRAKVVLVAGFSGLLVAVWAAHTSPATGYELSIYERTPLTVWVGLAAALAAALAVSVSARSAPIRTAALVLATGAGLAVAGLPVLRGYHFYGAADSLSHLGLAKGFLSGQTSPTNLLYPGVHLNAMFLSRAGGAELEHAFMLIVLAFFLVFFLFVPLVTRAIVGDEVALGVGLFSALLLLPVNNVSVFPLTHPTTQTILFLPAVLYLAVNYVAVDPVGGRTRRAVTPVGGLLALTLAGVVLLHPQQAVNLALVLVTVATLQFLARRVRRGHAFARHRSLSLHALFLVLLLALWTPRSGRTQSTRENLLTRLLEGASVGDTIGQRGESLTALGGSIEELYLKLFLASTVFVLVCGPFLLGSVAGRFDRHLPERNSPVKYLGFCLVPVFGMFVLYFATSITTQHFRHLGFLMALTTIVGATAVSYAVVRARADGSRRVVATTAICLLFFGGLLVLSVAALHPSPYIFKDNPEITQAHVDGYATAFDVRDPGIPFAGVRDGPHRYVDAVYGTGPRGIDGIGRDVPASATFPGREDVVPAPVFNAANYTDHYEGERYVAITDTDVEREVRLYDGFRYSAGGFRALDATAGINRVHTNGAVTLYLLSGSGG